LALLAKVRTEKASNKIEKEVKKMLTYKGGHKVGKGTYWDVRSGQRIDVAGESILPGGEDSQYLKLPVGVMLLSGPFVGLLYVVFLPFVGIAMIVAAAGREVLGGLVSLIGKTISTGWRPQSAYLSGKKKERAKDKGSKK
jgi:hypothetical protein